MRFLRFAPVLLIVTACATAPAPQPAVQAAVQPAVAEEASFALRQGANQIATDRFRRTAQLLEGDLTAPNGARVAYMVQLRPDASVSHIEVRQFAPGAAADAAPAQQSSGTFRGDTVHLTQVQGGETQTAHRTTVPGVVPYLNPSPAFMEQIVRRARAMGGERVEVPIWIPTGGQNATATVAFTAPGAAVLSLGGVEVQLQVDPQGRVTGGSVPAQGLTIERTAAQPR
jgi:hypothetical protein